MRLQGGFFYFHHFFFIVVYFYFITANKDQIFDQLKLALAWNRIDIAKSEIFTDDRFIQVNRNCEFTLSWVYTILQWACDFSIQPSVC